MFVHTHSSLALPDIAVSPRMSVCVSHNMYIYIYIYVCVCIVFMCVNANSPIYDFGRIVVIVHTNVRQQKLKRQIILTIPNQFELPRITKTLILIMVVTVILSHCPGDHPVSNDICTAKPNTTRQIMKTSIWHCKLLIIFSMDLHVSSEWIADFMYITYDDTIIIAIHYFAILLRQVTEAVWWPRLLKKDG